MKNVQGERVTSIESKEISPAPEPPVVAMGDERYPFSFAFDFVAGKAEVREIFKRPIIAFCPEHLVSNVRGEGTATLVQLYAGNIVCLLGDGLDLACAPDEEDGILGTAVRFPWVTPASDVTMRVSYSGRFPAGFFPGDTYRIVVTLTGSTKP